MKIPCFLSFLIYFFHYFFINYLSSLQLQTALINTHIPHYLHMYSPCIPTYTYFFLFIYIPNILHLLLRVLYFYNGQTTRLYARPFYISTLLILCFPPLSALLVFLTASTFSIFYSFICFLCFLTCPRCSSRQSYPPYYF